VPRNRTATLRGAFSPSREGIREPIQTAIVGHARIAAHPEWLFELALGVRGGRRTIESALLSALEPTA
jgi:hypothetical protein